MPVEGGVAGGALGQGAGPSVALGVYTTVIEICDSKNSSKSYVSRILRLALLAPDIY